MLRISCNYIYRVANVTNAIKDILGVLLLLYSNYVMCPQTVPLSCSFGKTRGWTPGLHRRRQFFLPRRRGWQNPLPEPVTLTSHFHVSLTAAPVSLGLYFRPWPPSSVFEARERVPLPSYWSNSYEKGLHFERVTSSE